MTDSERAKPFTEAFELQFAPNPSDVHFADITTKVEKEVDKEFPYPNSSIPRARPLQYHLRSASEVHQGKSLVKYLIENEVTNFIIGAVLTALERKTFNVGATLANNRKGLTS